MSQQPYAGSYLLYVPYVGIGVMQAVSFVMLGIGVLKIRGLIVQNDSSEINNRRILLHMVCFALYLITLCFLLYRTLISELKGVNNIDRTIYWATLSQVIFFLMMMTLLRILYNLGVKAQIDYSDTSSRLSNIQSPQSMRQGRLSMQKRLIERHQLESSDLNSTM